MKKREAKFCTDLGKWWINIGHKLLPLCNYKIEAKIAVKYAPFNFKSGIKPHQTPTLLAYNSKPMYWKISDIDTISTKHYDIDWSKPDENKKALFAFQWVRRGNKTFYLIEPITIQGLIDDGFKSLTEEMASKISVAEFKLTY